MKLCCKEFLVSCSHNECYKRTFFYKRTEWHYKQKILTKSMSPLIDVSVLLHPHLHKLNVDYSVYAGLQECVDTIFSTIAGRVSTTVSCHPCGPSIGHQTAQEFTFFILPDLKSAHKFFIESMSLNIQYT